MTVASTEDLMRELDRLLDRLRAQIATSKQIQRKAVGADRDRPDKPDN